MAVTVTLTRRQDRAVDAALDAAVRALRGRQHPQGWWKGELETNVTMDAEDLMLRHILGILDPDTAAAAARWIRSQQGPDGGWATFYGGPPDLSTTVEAYVALRLAGDPPEAAHMRRAAATVRALGGVERSRVFTRTWLAMCGLLPWRGIPVIPPELVLLPASAPISIYDFACWARQTIVPLTIVHHHRPVRPAPFDIPELRTGAPAPQPSAVWAVLQRALEGIVRHPLPGLRAAALAAAERWIIQRQEADGSWGGIQPPWVYSIIALHLRGYPLSHPVLARALEGLDGFLIVDDRGRRLEACQSPVWDTALAVTALRDAGVPADDPDLLRAGRWLLGQEVRQRGDWTVRRPHLPAGGWAFEFANVNYPDVDDTAEVVLALQRLAFPDPDRDRVRRATGRAVRWVLGMRSRNGAWGAFDADNTREWPTRLPFCDFGAVTDPPSADVTAHAVEMLCATGHRHHHATQRAVAWLLAQQERDGSWFGRWGVNHIYGTGAVVPALVAAGLHPRHAAIRAAVRWLAAVQNPDGGWGEDIRSYRDRSWRGRGTSTASQTAWALLALLAAGERGEVVERGVRWLVDHQTTDGSWEEPWFTGTGFPWDFSINYHLYRLVFPTSALGRYRAALAGEVPR